MLPPYVSTKSTEPADKKTRLVSYAHFEARALKSSLLKDDIRKLRAYLSQNSDEVRNIYGYITGDETSPRALSFIRRCSPHLYPYKGLKNITYRTESFSQSIIAFEYPTEDDHIKIYRLYYSSLELLFMRATFNELRALVAFLVDDTRYLKRFNTRKWRFKKPEFAVPFKN